MNYPSVSQVELAGRLSTLDPAKPLDQQAFFAALRFEKAIRYQKPPRLPQSVCTRAIPLIITGLKLLMLPIIAVRPDRTTYQLQTVTDASNCPLSLVSAMATVAVNSVNPASISPENASLCRGQSLILTAGSSIAGIRGILTPFLS